MTGLPTELRSHKWMDSYENVSVDGDSGLYVVRLDTRAVPEHMVNSDRFDVLELWVDTVPTALWSWLPERFCREAGFGRTGVSILIEVRE